MMMRKILCITHVIMTIVKSKEDKFMNDLRHAEFLYKEGALLIVLDYLRHFTSESRTLTQEEMCEEIEREYGLKISRNTLRKHLNTLNEAGFYADPKKNYVLDEKEFEDSEIAVLIDSLIYTNAISADNAEEIIDKLLYFGTEKIKKDKKYFISRMNNYSGKKGKDLIFNYEEIKTAIAENKKIRLNYKILKEDLVWYRKYPTAGVLASPYELVISNNRYVMICAVDGEDTLSEMSLDRTTNVTVTDEKRRPLSTIPGFKERGTLEEYIKLSPTLGGGLPETFTVRVDNDVLSEFVERVGGEIRKDTVNPENDDFRTVIKVKTTPNNLRLAMLPMLDMVTVLGNESFNKQLEEMLRKGIQHSHIMKIPKERRTMFIDFDELFKLAISQKRRRFILNNGTPGQIKRLREIDTLSHLTFFDTDLRGIDYLDGLENVTSLRLARCKFDTAYLTDKQNIDALSITGADNDGLKDINKMKGLESIEVFFGEFGRRPSEFIKGKELGSIEFLKDMQHLQRITLEGFDLEGDLSFLKEFKDLKVFRAGNCRISDEKKEELCVMLPECRVSVNERYGKNKDKK